MKKSMCAKWFEIKLWKKLIILFSITFIIIFVTLFETTPVNLNASNISEIYIGMHSMMTDDIITGKASIKGREDVKNVVCSLNRILRCGNTANPAGGKPPVRTSGNQLLCEFTRVTLCPIHRLPALRCHALHQYL